MSVRSLLCDFCMAEAPLEEFPTATFLGANAWSACPDCAADIRANQREALARRAVESLAARHPQVMELVGAAQAYLEVTRLHDGFFRHRVKGEE